MQEHRRHPFDPWVRKIHWRRKWQFTPLFLPGETQGQRSLAGSLCRSHKESHAWMTEHRFRFPSHFPGVLSLSTFSLWLPWGSHLTSYVNSSLFSVDSNFSLKMFQNFIFLFLSTKFFFLNMYILLKYSWLTMFQVHSKVIQIYIYTCIIFEMIFHYRLLKDIDYSSLCYTVILCCIFYF